MKSKKVYFLPLLALTPLLMANAPAPMVRPQEYKDFTCSFVSREDADTLIYPYKYFYNYEIYNTGSGYINAIYAESDTFYGELSGYDEIFDNIVILPGETAIFSFNTNKNVNLDGVEQKYIGFAYQDIIPDAFDNYNVEIEERISTYTASTEYYYWVSFDTKVNLKSNDYEYGLIVELTYKGQKYAVHKELGTSKEFRICETEEQLDLSQLTIDKLTMTKGPKYKSALGTFIVVALVLFFTFIALSVGGIIFAIVFPIARRARRKRLENANK